MSIKIINAVNAKEQTFRYIANSDKMKNILKFIDEVSQKGVGEIIVNKEQCLLSSAEIQYLREKKFFIVSNKIDHRNSIKISWI